MSDYNFVHSPGASLDYGFWWQKWLEPTETIEDSDWTASPTITLDRGQITGGVTSIFVTGGVAGTSYTITNTITTSLGRTDSRKITLLCAAR